MQFLNRYFETEQKIRTEQTSSIINIGSEKASWAWVGVLADCPAMYFVLVADNLLLVSQQSVELGDQLGLGLHQVNLSVTMMS